MILSDGTMITKVDRPPYESQERFLMEVMFDGTKFCGWQCQNNDRTVQEDIQNLLSGIYAGLPIKVSGSSRTDSGVHARGMAATFAAPLRPTIEREKLRRAMNRMLPTDIRIRKIRSRPMDFSPRFDAIGKAYVYVLNLGDENPFSSGYSWQLRKMMDIAAMQEAAAVLVGKHDFSSFVVHRSQIDEAVRTIYRIEFERFDNYLCISFVGNSFLYKMIRCLTGLLVAIGRGELGSSEVKGILEGQDRQLAPQTAPAHGLFLMKVFYENKEMEQWKLRTVPFFV